MPGTFCLTEISRENYGSDENFCENCGKDSKLLETNPRFPSHIRCQALELFLRPIYFLISLKVRVSTPFKHLSQVQQGRQKDGILVRIK